MENADYYLIEISSTDNFFSYLTTDTSIRVEDLDPDQIYFWIIAPFNETSTGIKSTAKVLQTNSDFTAVENLENIADIFVYPNPIKLGDQLIVDISSETNFEAELEILSVDGKVVQVIENAMINKGDNKLSIETTELQQGMYFLQIKNDVGVYTKQIVLKIK